MLIIHHLGISQSGRIVWLCEELEIPYQLIHYDRDPQIRLTSKQYKELHPTETAPVIIDDNVILAESGAIIDYIISKYGNGRFKVKPDNPNIADYLFWYHFANGSMMPAFLVDLVVKLLAGDTENFNAIVETLQQRAYRAIDLAERRLGTNDYFAENEFTSADIMMVFPLTTMRAFSPFDLTSYPNIRAYLKRIGARPGYQRAMKKGDPDFIPLLD
ncbi:unnamed protein product [Rotaria sordida]|uniref:glutathione transferase n=1 Tax=Rotaria sordida TaxID=392033 RepID=A0A816A5L3_9BILA|nr:unnamed protein product [Rotaria sordida]CAF1590754.1 unnamed protein product [Rotaria sordida]